MIRNGELIVTPFRVLQRSILLLALIFATPIFAQGKNPGSGPHGTNGMTDYFANFFIGGGQFTPHTFEKYFETLLYEGTDVEEIDPDLLEEVVAKIADYVWPIPRRNAEANYAAYRALSILKPDNQTYIERRDYYAPIVEQNRRSLMSRLRAERDDFKKITWYHHPNEPRFYSTRKSVYVYIGKPDDGDAYARVVFNYTAKDWLFVDKVLLLADGEVYEDELADFKRDYSSGVVWEWSDNSVNKGNLHSSLTAIGNSDVARVRFDGRDYYSDFTLSTADRDAIQEMLAAVDYINDAKVPPPPPKPELPTAGADMQAGSSQDSRWIVIASSRDVSTLPLTKAINSFGGSAVKIMQSVNGYYALVLGPYTAANATSQLRDYKSNRSVPNDAYLSSGSRFVSQIR